MQIAHGPLGRIEALMKETQSKKSNIFLGFRFVQILKDFAPAKTKAKRIRTEHVSSASAYPACS